METTEETDRLLMKIEELENRLSEAEQLIDAIKSGEVDAFALSRNNKPEIFTLQSGDYMYRILVENFGEGALNLTEEGLIVYTNKYFHELVHKSYDRVIGSEIYQYIHPDSREAFNELFKIGLAGQSKGEINLIAGSKTIPVYVSLTSQYPTLPTVGMIVTDISEKKQHEKILLQHKELQHIFSQAPAAISLLEAPQLRFVQANMFFQKMVNRTEKQLAGRTAGEVFPELNGQGIFEVVKEVLRTGEPFTAHEFSLSWKKDNKNLNNGVFDFVVQPIRNPEGVISFIMIHAVEVTEQIEARKKLERSINELELFKFMVDNVSDFIGICDMNFITFYVNMEGLLLTGLDSLEELKKKPVSDFFFPEDVAFMMNEFFPKVVETGRGETEIRFRNFKTGEALWMIYSVVLVLDSKQQPAGFATISKNITEKKRASEQLKIFSEDLEDKVRQRTEELRSQKEFSETIVNSSNDLIGVYDKDMRILVFNKACEELFGLKREEIIGKKYLDVFPSAASGQGYKDLQRALNGEMIRNDIYHSELTDRYYQNSLTPLWDASNSVYAVVVIGHDITEIVRSTEQIQEANKELKKANKDLLEANLTIRTNEERYQRMIKEIEDYAILSLSPGGMIENWNEGAQKIKGYTAEEIVGKNFSIFYTQADKESGLPGKLLNEAAQKGKATHEGWRVRKDGTRFWGSILITALHDDQNRVVGYSKVTRDLTDRKNAEDAIRIANKKLEQKNEALEKMNKELESFTYISSHDLQEPLRKIRTFAGRILEKESMNLSESGKDYFERMTNAANRMQTLIQDLLTFSRLNTTEHVFETVDPVSIIQDVLSDFQEAVTEKKASISIGSMENMKVIPFQFRQLINNLVSNSLKYSEPGIPPKITITESVVDGGNIGNDLLREEEYHHIIFRDEGIGFEPRFNEKIFEVFQKLHGKDQYPGTGIGLAIVKKIIENHAGHITASGQPGKGVTFDIFLPVRKSNNS